MINSASRRHPTDGPSIELYPSGDVYEGHFVAGQKCGTGTLTCKNGDIYEGNWLDNVFHGHGVYRYGQSGDCYNGHYEKGQRHGHGVLRYGDGSRLYIGSWKCNKRHGEGVEYFFYGEEEGGGKTGQVKLMYEGEFREGQRCGKGRLVYDPPEEEQKVKCNATPTPEAGATSLTRIASNSSSAPAAGKNGGAAPEPAPLHTYDGEWAKDHQDGKGREVYRSGAVYDGEYQRGEKCGRGVYRFADGSIYKGKFKQNQPHGGGVMLYANGDLYEGYFVGGQRQGHGRCVRRCADGKGEVIYEGRWKRNKPHGDESSVRCPNGDLYQGYAQLGKVLGERQHPPRERIRRQVYSDDSDDSWDEAEESEESEDLEDYELLYRKMKDRLKM